MGYVGHRAARHEILKGLRRLEYLGYDSTGIAEWHDHHIAIVRSEGRVDALVEKLEDDPHPASIAIGHTRWATHGAPCERNAHPHRDCAGRIAIVQNGIIDNHRERRRYLEKRGHYFVSDTDTEVVAHLLEEHYRGNLQEATRTVLEELEGNFSLCILHAHHELMLVVHHGNPIVIGIGDGEFMCTSDASTLIEVTRDIIYLDDGDLAEIKCDSLKVWGANGGQLPRQVQRLNWSLAQIQRDRFDHFMRKEIEDQPRVIANVLAGRVQSDGELSLPELAHITDNRDIERVLLVGCGSSYHASLCGHVFLEQLGIPHVRTEIGSELKTRPERMRESDLVILTSQSGETEDIIACLKLAQSMQIPTLAICNVVGSSLARISNAVLFTQAGPEIALASTKAFTSQVVSLALVALALGWDEYGREQLQGDLNALPTVISAALAQEDRIRLLAQRYAKSKATVFLGSGLGYAVAHEASLKLTEISYLPALAHATGEMKHGPLALIGPEVLTVLIVHGPGGVPEARLAHCAVTKRGGPCVVFGATWEEAEATAIELPHLSSPLGFLGANLLAQLFAYHVATFLGHDIDEPRKLQKSVMVA